MHSNGLMDYYSANTTKQWLGPIKLHHVILEYSEYIIWEIPHACGTLTITTVDDTVMILGKWLQ